MVRGDDEKRDTENPGVPPVLTKALVMPCRVATIWYHNFGSSAIGNSLTERETGAAPFNK